MGIPTPFYILMMKKIESRSNPIIKNAFQIAKGKDSLVMIEGHKLLEEALKSGFIPEMIFVENEAAFIYPNCFFNSCFLITKKIMRELSTLQTPSEIVSFLKPPARPFLNEFITTSKLIVVLDRLQDPGNIGTIIRTSEAMGADAVFLLPGCCDKNNIKVTRGAMGSSFRLPIYDNLDVNYLFMLFNKHNFETICADMSGKPIFNYKFSDKCAIFFGQEGQGLSETILTQCKTKLAIPMQGQVESLNVATSAAIFLYEKNKNCPI